MNQDNKQNTSGQISGGGLPPLSGAGADVKDPKKVSEKVPVSSGSPIKPEPVESKPADVSAVPDSEGLPPLEIAEDETFNLGVVNKKEEDGKEKKREEVEKTTLPPLPATGVDQTSEDLKEVKKIDEINSENQETPPPPPPDETPVAPGKTEEKPPITEGIDMGDDGEGEKKKGKKKISKKTIIGGLIALVLLIGVPVLALNLDYFRGDVRERAWIPEGLDPTSPPTRTPTRTPTIARVQTPNPTQTPKPPTRAPTKESGCTSAQFAKCESRGECCSAPSGLCVPCRGTPTKASTIEWCPYDCVRLLSKCTGENLGQGYGDCEVMGYCCETGGIATETPIPTIIVSNEPCKECGGVNDCDNTKIVGCKSSLNECENDGDCGEAPTKTPTTTPTAGVCMNIKIYTLQDGLWTETLMVEVGQYASVGDTIRLALKGNSSTFVRGRFRVVVGGVPGSWIETNKKNGNGELYLDYLLENGGSYSVEGEIRK